MSALTATFSQELRALTDYREMLDAALASGDIAAAARAVATMNQQLHMIGLVVDPRREFVAAITSSNGAYMSPCSPAARLPL